MARTEWLKVRLTPDEHAAMQRKADEAGMSVSELVRDHLGAVAVVNRDDRREFVRQVARVGANLNQLARWVNTYKHATESMAVLRALREIGNELRELRRDRTAVAASGLAEGTEASGGG